MNGVVRGDHVEAGVRQRAQAVERIRLDEADAAGLDPLREMRARLIEHFGRAVDRGDMQVVAQSQQRQRADARAAADLEDLERLALAPIGDPFGDAAGEQRGIGADQLQHPIFGADRPGEEIFVDAVGHYGLGIGLVDWVGRSEGIGRASLKARGPDAAWTSVASAELREAREGL